MSQGLRVSVFVALAALMVMMVSAVHAQTPPPGNSTVGESLWNDNGCSGCHTLAKARGDITARAPAGMSFDKALAALNAALNGTDLDNMATGMQGFAAALTSANRNDLAAYIAGLAGPAPIVSYTPTGGAIFTATAVGASSNATVTIRNTGTAPLTFAMNNAVTIATGGDSSDFRVASTTCNPASTLAAGSGSCTITVTFTPNAGASLTRTASIGLATTTSTSLVPMQGSVSVPAAAAPPTGAANAPSSGGGGAMPWQAVLLALGCLVGARRPRG